MATATVTRAPAKPAKASVPWTTDLWVITMLDVLNANLKRQGRPLVPITRNNIENVQRIMATEVAGQQGGFLRDNNPLNVGTFCGPHGPLYGAEKTIAPFGPDPRCSGGKVYLNVFATPLAGAQGTVRYLLQYGGNLISAMQHDAPTALFAGASPGWAVGASPLKETATKTAPPGTSAVTPTPYHETAPGTANAKIRDAILAAASSGKPWSARLRAQYLALLPGDRKATLDAVYAQLAKERNLSLWGEVQAAAKGVGSGVAGVVTGAAGWTVAAAKVLGELGSATFWKRVGIGATGIALVVGGGVIFLSTTKPVQEGAKAAAGVL